MSKTYAREERPDNPSCRCSFERARHPARRCARARSAWGAHALVRNPARCADTTLNWARSSGRDSARSCRESDARGVRFSRALRGLVRGESDDCDSIVWAAWWSRRGRTSVHTSVARGHPFFAACDAEAASFDHVQAPPRQRADLRQNRLVIGGDLSAWEVRIPCGLRGCSGAAKHAKSTGVSTPESVYPRGQGAGAIIAARRRTVERDGARLNGDPARRRAQRTFERTHRHESTNEERSGTNSSVWLDPGFASNPSVGTAYFKRALEQLGWVEGRTVRFEMRYGEYEPDQTAVMARELVARSPTCFTRRPMGLCERRCRPRRPSDCRRAVADLVALGGVQSLARPGGNVTGVTHAQHGLDLKRLEI